MGMYLNPEMPDFNRYEKRFTLINPNLLQRLIKLSEQKDKLTCVSRPRRFESRLPHRCFVPIMIKPVILWTYFLI